MTKLDLKGSVLLTIAYSSIFSFPLTLVEIKKRLLFYSETSDRKLGLVLKKLAKLKQIDFVNNYFLIGNRSFVPERVKRLGYAKTKIEQSKYLIKILSFIPGVRALAISGSTAVDNAKIKDDLDWLVITSDSSLWLVRPLLIILASIFGKRRGRNGHHRDNSWCFNMFLSESSLLLPKDKRSVYTAYEICQARFVLGKGGVEKKFLLANVWVREYLPNFYHQRLSECQSQVVAKKRVSLGLIKSLNKIAFNIQYWYMKSHITREIVAENLALFHPRDTKKTIYIKWLKLINLPYVKS